MRKKNQEVVTPENDTVQVAESQKMTYTFHIKDRKIVIEATSKDEAEKKLANIIKNL